MKTPGGDGGEILHRRPHQTIDQQLTAMGLVKISDSQPGFLDFPIYRFPGPAPRRRWISRETMSVVVGASFGFWAAFYLTGLAALVLNFLGVLR